MSDSTKTSKSDTSKQWRYTFENPITEDAVERFIEGVTGLTRCSLVADALVEGGFPMPVRSDTRAQVVAWMLRAAANIK